MKTIRELADELGMTKNKIKYHASKLNHSERLMVDNITYLTDDGVAKIKALLVVVDNRLSTSTNNHFLNHLEKILEAQNTTNELLAELVSQQKALPPPPMGALGRLKAAWAELWRK